jgi:DNA-binding NarL/FixJ family response regulator
MVRIALVSDDRLFLDGIVKILQTAPDYLVVDRGAGPAILLIDSQMVGALTLCGQARGEAAALMIAAPADSIWCREALCAGAGGVLPKNAGSDALIDAVRVVSEGSVWAPRRAMADCIKHLLTGSVSRRFGNAMLENRLSKREREIFRQAATGLANKELAARFAIGEATVKAHLTRIFQKLGVRGRAELAAVYHGGDRSRDAMPTPARLIPLRPITPTVVRQRSNPIAEGALKK